MKKDDFADSSGMLVYSLITVPYLIEDDMMIEEVKPKGKINIGLSVHPAEFQNTSGLYITVSGILLDEEPVKGFVPQTLDLMLYQEGDVELIYSSEAEVGKYQSVTLLFDMDSDNKGSSPGCYFLYEDGTKQSFVVGTGIGRIQVQKNYRITEGNTTELIAGFDLKKMESRLNNKGKKAALAVADSLKAFVKDKCGQIKGSVRKPIYLPGEMYVLIYKKGMKTTRTTGNTEDFQSLFERAVAVTKVKPYGNFELALLEEGEYEIRLASYDPESQKTYLFRGIINPTSNIQGLLLNSISVSAQNCVQLNIDITGVI
jgi:hypothetical protein